MVTRDERLRAREKATGSPRDRVPAEKRECSFHVTIDPAVSIAVLLCSRWSCEILSTEKRQRRKAEETVRKGIICTRAEGSREKKGSSEKGNLRTALSDLSIGYEYALQCSLVAVRLPDECNSPTIRENCSAGIHFAQSFMCMCVCVSVQLDYS